MCQGARVTRLSITAPRAHLAELGRGPRGGLSLGCDKDVGSGGELTSPPQLWGKEKTDSERGTVNE